MTGDSLSRNTSGTSFIGDVIGCEYEGPIAGGLIGWQQVVVFILTVVSIVAVGTYCFFTVLTEIEACNNTTIYLESHPELNPDIVDLVPYIVCVSIAASFIIFVELFVRDGA